MFEDIYGLEIFKWIEKKIVDNIVKNCPTRKYQEWKTIIKEWEHSNWEGYIIKQWKIAITINNKKIAELWVGNLFWEIALLNEEERTASAIALEELEVIILSLDNLIEMINYDSNNINKLIITRIEENLAEEPEFEGNIN